MAKSKKPHFTFTARLQEAMYGNFTYSAAFLPKKIVGELPASRLRTKGTLNDIPFTLAVQFRKDGRSFFLFSRSLCKKAGVHVGSTVKIEFVIVDPNVLELPEELEAVLAQDDEARKVWEKFPVGRRRSYTIYITSVKNVDSRIKRSLELAHKIKFGQLHSQREKNK